MTYLLDEAVEIGGVRFWGTPWSTLLPGWAFMEPEAKLPLRWAAIPPETDVLVVHGPPFGSLDKTAPRFGGEHVGSPSLRGWIERQQPEAVICGHIHEGFGVDRIGSTAVYNVSYLDASYEHSPNARPSSSTWPLLPSPRGPREPGSQPAVSSLGTCGVIPGPTS